MRSLRRDSYLVRCRGYMAFGRHGMDLIVWPTWRTTRGAYIMSSQGNLKPQQNENGTSRRTATLKKKKKKKQSRTVLAWSAGVLATVLAAVLVTVITGGAHAIWSAINQHKYNSVPLVISPAKIHPGPLKSPGYKTDVSGPAVTRIGKILEHYERLKQVYYLSGTVPKESLPKISELHRTAVGPRTSWYLDLNVVGNSSSPVVITGMSVHVIRRLPPRQVTSVDSCWRYKCTPKPETDATLGRLLAVRGVTVNLDNTKSNINVTSVGGGHFPYIVTSTDDEFFRLFVHSARCTCRWVVYVQWEQGGHVGKKLFENGSSPFEVVTDNVVRRYCYDSGNERGYANVADRKSVRHVCEKR